MAVTTLQGDSEQRQSTLRPVAIVVGLAFLLFLALPWSFDHKLHAALHGLCAQRPSHTYSFGGRPLPFDARMTGIYLGALVTMVVLVIRGAHRFGKQPSTDRFVLLGVLGGAMALDGFNSFLDDMKVWHPYETANWMRLVTGMGAGIVLAFALVFLVAGSVWRRSDLRRQTLDSWRDVLVIWAVFLPLIGLVLSGWGFLYVPIALTLLVGALVVLSTLALVLIVILRRQDFSFTTFDSLGSNAMWAVFAGTAAMALLAIGRTVLERTAGGSPLT